MRRAEGMAMSLDEAVAVCAQGWTDDNDEAIEAAQGVILRAGYCPECATTENGAPGELFKLGPWSEGNYYEYAGRECRQCEEFFPDDYQPEYSELCDESEGYDE